MGMTTTHYSACIEIIKNAVGSRSKLDLDLDALSEAYQICLAYYYNGMISGEDIAGLKNIIDELKQ
jgi:hypothetical protein